MTFDQCLDLYYPEEKATILQRWTKEDGPEDVARRLQDHMPHGHSMLAALFIWERTPEGAEYWRALDKRMVIESSMLPDPSPNPRGFTKT